MNLYNYFDSFEAGGSVEFSPKPEYKVYIHGKYSIKSITYNYYDDSWTVLGDDIGAIYSSTEFDEIKDELVIVCVEVLGKFNFSDIKGLI